MKLPASPSRLLIRFILGSYFILDGWLFSMLSIFNPPWQQALQAILGKRFRHVVVLVLKCPALLLADMDSARKSFEGLRNLLLLKEGSVYAMVSCSCQGAGAVG